MNTLKGFAPALLLTFLAFSVSARAQTPASETDAPAPQDTLAPTGSGTAGKIPKWTTATNLGNSVITESAGKVGVNIAAPAARLHVFGATPPAVATDGTDAALLFRTTGGWGGDTTGTTGQTAGNGASISLYAGKGGNAPAGSVRGNGGNIFIQPGLAGGGAGYGGYPGDVLIGPAGVGNVGIGTFSPDYKLHVAGGSGTAVYGKSSINSGVVGASTSSSGVLGISFSGNGVSGYSSYGYGVHGSGGSSAYAGYFEGKARVTGHLQVASCTGCTISSDRGLKENVSEVDPRSVLAKLAALPVREWNYKEDEPSVRHLGPMAQDFRQAFNLGDDDKHIDMVDANGVTMASIQALYQLMLEKDRQNQELVGAVREQSQQIGLLRAQLQRQQAQLNQVKRTIRRKRAAQR